MEIPEVLRCATSYLNKIRSIEGEHRIDVPSTLVDVLQKAAGEAKEELKGRVIYPRLKDPYLGW